MRREGEENTLFVKEPITYQCLFLSSFSFSLSLLFQGRIMALGDFLQNSGDTIVRPERLCVFLYLRRKRNGLSASINPFPPLLLPSSSSFFNLLFTSSPPLTHFVYNFPSSTFFPIIFSCSLMLKVSASLSKQSHPLTAVCVCVSQGQQRRGLIKTTRHCTSVDSHVIFLGRSAATTWRVLV